MLFRLRFIGQRQSGNFAGVLQRNEYLLLGVHAVPAACNNCVSQTVAAGILFQRRSGGHKAGIPDRAVILNVEVVSVAVGGAIVIAIAGQTQQLGIPVKGVPTSGVRAKRKEVLAAQIVDPGKRRQGSRNYVLAALIVKVAIAHG